MAFSQGVGFQTPTFQGIFSLGASPLMGSTAGMGIFQGPLTYGASDGASLFSPLAVKFSALRQSSVLFLHEASDVIGTFSHSLQDAQQKGSELSEALTSALSQELSQLRSFDMVSGSAAKQELLTERTLQLGLNVMVEAKSAAKRSVGVQATTPSQQGVAASRGRKGPANLIARAEQDGHDRVRAMSDSPVALAAAQGSHPALMSAGVFSGREAGISAEVENITAMKGTILSSLRAFSECWIPPASTAAPASSHSFPENAAHHVGGAAQSTSAAHDSNISRELGTQEKAPASDREIPLRGEKASVGAATGLSGTSARMQDVMVGRALRFASQQLRTDGLIASAKTPTGETSFSTPRFIREGATAVLRIPGQSRLLRGTVRPGAEKLTVATSFAGEPVNLSFVEYAGTYRFAGWERAADRRDAEAMVRASALPLPDLLTPLQRTVFGFGTPGGESAYKLPYFEAQGGSIEEHVISSIKEQLSRGPHALSDDRALTALNMFLMQSGHFGVNDEITPERWEGVLQQTLRFAVQATPLFGSHGMRSIPAVQDDAAGMLGIDAELFDAWEEHFGMESFSESLFGNVASSLDVQHSREAHAKLLQGVERQIALLSLMRFGRGPEELGISQEEDVALQWKTARVSLLTDPVAKAEAAFDLLHSLKRRQIKSAGRALALIVSHSELNAVPSSEAAPLARWSTADLMALLRHLMKHQGWDIASHRSFRQHLDAEQNAFINEAIRASNLDHAVEQMRRLDVTQVSDAEFWQALDGTGLSDVILDTAIEKMEIQRYI